MKIGLVIPCYNYSAGLSKSFEKILQWRSKQALNLQVCFVDDGSTDATSSVLREITAPHSDWCHFISLARNQGKGAAVRTGFSYFKDKVDCVVFTDCDLHYGLRIISDRLIPSLEDNDIAILDRSWIVEARHRSVLRRMASGIFNRAVSILTDVNYHDTQAGLKAFRVSSCAPVFDVLSLRGFAFDVEVLSIALHYRLRIAQVPIRFSEEYEFPETSTISLIKNSLKMFSDLLVIGRNWRKGRYRNSTLIRKIDASVYEIAP